MQLFTRSHRIQQSRQGTPHMWAVVLLMHNSSVRNKVLSAEVKLTSGLHRMAHLSALAGDLFHSVFCSYLIGSLQGQEGGLLIPHGHANSCRTHSTLIPLFPLLNWALPLSYYFLQSVSSTHFSSSCLWLCELQSPPVIDWNAVTGQSSGRRYLKSCQRHG